MLLSAVVVAMPGCFGVIDHMDEDCSCVWDAEINFRYHPTPTQEALPTYVGSMTHLLFCNDVLVGTLSINGTTHGEGLFDTTTEADGSTPEATYTLRGLRMSLPEGTYTLMTWGNYLSGVSVLEDTVTGLAPQIGTTRISDVHLSHKKASPANHGTLDNCERLYFGHCEFTVSHVQSASHTVDMLNAHMQLSVMVVWKGVTPPTNLRDIRMRLVDTQVGYLHQTTDVLPFSISSPMPTYGPREVKEYVPACNSNVGTISADVSTLESAKIWSQLIGYRFRDESRPLLSLWSADGNTRLMKDIDLGRFFETLGWERTRNHRQYYEILVTIHDNDQVTVEPLENIGWIDGGVIGAHP